MNLENYDSLRRKLEEEKTLRLKLEDDNRKLKEILAVTEEKLHGKSQELTACKIDFEFKLRASYLDIGSYKNNEKNYQKDIESLRQSLNNTKKDYYKATDEGISKASELESLYAIIAQYRAEIDSLRNHVAILQNDVVSLEKDNKNLLRFINVEKSSKFSQTQCYDLSAPVSPKKTGKSFVKNQSNFGASLPLDYSLQKVKSQMLALQKSKAKLDTQLKFLTNFSE